MNEMRPVETDASSLKQYKGLFKECFPKAREFSESYVKWLYHDNPEGRVIGFDAWDGDVLCAHYVCIPTSIEISGRPYRALLSLNTATHPKYQGKGLFTKLANRVYECAAEKGYDCIYGIANANSTPGFTRKLGFTNIGPLDAKIGIGSVSRFSATPGASMTSSFRRVWTHETFRWRLSNPRNPARASIDRKGNIQAFAPTEYVGIHAYAELSSLEGSSIANSTYPLGLRLFLGITPERKKKSALYMPIPKTLRPSPLNFIFRALKETVPMPTAENASVSFLDFDAY